MINYILNYLFSFDRKIKIFIQVIFDLILIFLTFTISMFLRLDHFLFFKDINFWNCLLVLMFFVLIIFFKLNLYKNIIRFVTTKILNVIFISSILSGLFLLTYSQAFNYFVPRSVPFIFIILFFLSASSIRLLFKNIYLYKNYNKKIGLGIVGINEQTIQFLKVIDQNNNYKPICFFDNNSDYLNTKVGGLFVQHIDDISKVYPILFKTSSDPPFLKLITRFPDDNASNIVRGKLSIIEVQIYMSDSE